MNRGQSACPGYDGVGAPAGREGSSTVGWLALIVVLPFIGTLIYWQTRKPPRDETEQEYLAQAELRRSAGARPFASTGMGP